MDLVLPLVVARRLDRLASGPDLGAAFPAAFLLEADLPVGLPDLHLADLQEGLASRVAP
jgi:hypothetical protein